MSTGEDLELVPDGILRWPSYVLGQLHRRSRDAIDEALRAQGLSVREYFVLVCIDELGRASQQRVADSLGVDRSDLVKLLDRLQDQGLIARDRDPEDRRRHILALTPSGRGALARGTRVSEQVTAAELRNLTPAERHTLHVLVLKALGFER